MTATIAGYRRLIGDPKGDRIAAHQGYVDGFATPDRVVRPGDAYAIGHGYGAQDRLVLDWRGQTRGAA